MRYIYDLATNEYIGETHDNSILNSTEIKPTIPQNKKAYFNTTSNTWHYVEIERDSFNYDLNLSIQQGRYSNNPYGITINVSTDEIGAMSREDILKNATLEYKNIAL